MLCKCVRRGEAMRGEVSEISRRTEKRMKNSEEMPGTTQMQTRQSFSLFIVYKWLLPDANI